MESRENFPTSKMAEAVFALILLSKYKEDITGPTMNYEAFDGLKLPRASGCNLLNAMCTYISHGGAKTDAIEKFIDQHLRSFEAFNELLEFIGQQFPNQPSPPQEQLTKPDFLSK